MEDLSDGVERVREFASAVFVYCRRFHGSVTSWIRTPLRNVSVGGVPASQHLAGTAADVVLDSYHGYSAVDRLDFAKKLGLRLLVEKDHDHLMLL
jgi:hypothetical protein